MVHKRFGQLNFGWPHGWRVRRPRDRRHVASAWLGRGVPGGHADVLHRLAVVRHSDRCEDLVALTGFHSPRFRPRAGPRN